MTMPTNSGGRERWHKPGHTEACRMYQGVGCVCDVVARKTTPLPEPPQGELEELNSKLRLAGPALASDIARLVGELQTREYSKGKREGYRIGLVEGHMDNEAYQAGLSAALGALPESRSGEGSTRSFDFCAGFNAATDQARRNIEKLKEPSND